MGAAWGWRPQLSKRSETGPYVAFLNSTGRAAHGSALVDLPDGTVVSVWCSQGEGKANTSIVMASLPLGNDSLNSSPCECLLVCSRVAGARLRTRRPCSVVFHPRRLQRPVQ